ncbi:MAG: hypothetical protein FWF92_00640 [Oscillospiraceae bacterium]|nr:hypothetical protein [Oscillospiraceae bacterium]
MGRKKESLNINKVTFKYSGTDNDLTNFLKTVIHHHLVKNNIITDKPPINSANNIALKQ